MFDPEIPASFSERGAPIRSKGIFKFRSIVKARREITYD